MDSVRVKIAELVIDVSYFYPYQSSFFEDYLYDGDEPADITITMTRELIEQERVTLNEYDTPDDIIENTAIFRLIAEELPRFNTMLIHGSTISVDGKAYLFSAPSGTGKSTHTSLWSELLEADHDVFLINDDKPFVQVKDERVLVFGTPWKGKSVLGRNVCQPLAAIGIVNRAEKPWIEELPAGEVVGKLMQNTFRPIGAEAIRSTLSMLYELPLHVGVFECGCTLDISSAQLTYTVMSQKGEQLMKLKGGYISYEADDETILVATGDAVQNFHGLVRLNETASFVLSCLSEEISEKEIVDRMMSEYDGKREDMEEDVKNVLAMLKQIDALEYEEGELD